MKTANASDDHEANCSWHQDQSRPLVDAGNVNAIFCNGCGHILAQAIAVKTEGSTVKSSITNTFGLQTF
jgi:hypothetical protein